MARSKYPEEMYAAIGKACADGRIGPIDRTSIVSDAFALAKLAKLRPARFSRC